MSECYRITVNALTAWAHSQRLLHRYWRFVRFARTQTCGNCNGRIYRDRRNRPPPGTAPFVPVCPVCRRKAGWHVEPWLRHRKEYQRG